MPPWKTRPRVKGQALNGLVFLGSPDAYLIIARKKQTSGDGKVTLGNGMEWLSSEAVHVLYLVYQWSYDQK